MNSIGEKIQEFRQKGGLTQEGLAEKLDVSRQSVSKWELGQTLPEVDKIVAMGKLLGVTTDDLLCHSVEKPKGRDFLRLGCIYLVTKHMEAAIDFYEKLLSMRVSTRHPTFAEFFFDNHCIALIDERRLAGHDYSGGGDYKFALNFNVRDLIGEHSRLKGLNMGKVTGIKEGTSGYYYFQTRDPDGNMVEISGQLYDTRRNENMETVYCQSCAMDMSKEGKFGTNTDGSRSGEYCSYCFADGGFTSQMNFEQAVEVNLPFWREGFANDDDARQKIREVFSQLKRWQNQN